VARQAVITSAASARGRDISVHRRRSEGQLLLRLLQRLVVLGVVLTVLALLPWGGPLGPVRVKHAVLTLLAVAGIGKALLDTFYYDRYRP